MAYMSQANKKSKEPKLKAIFKKYNLKGSVSVDNNSSLVVTLKAGAIDFISNYNKSTENTTVDNIQVNPYHFHNHFTGVALDALTEIFEIMNDGNHDRSDSQSDYFDVGWYNNVNIGKWNVPYKELAVKQ